MTYPYRVLGAILIIGGLLVAFTTMNFMDTTVETQAVEIAGQTIGGRIHNIGLMQQKNNTVLCAVGAAIVGAILCLVPGQKKEGEGAK